jgi:SAM-dependent methyltransferase
MADQSIPEGWQAQNAYTLDAWDTNAAFWDERMGDGNAHYTHLVAPNVDALLDVAENGCVLELACGNGIYARRLADSGLHVLATDFAPRMVELAEQRSSGYEDRFEYRVVDATSTEQLAALGGPFEAIVCLMGLMDMASLDALATTGRSLLRPHAPFVFALTHPCFNHGGMSLVSETEVDADGRSGVVHSVKVRRYKHAGATLGEAMLGQPKPQLYFDRPLEALLGVFFEAGWTLDGLREPAFAAGSLEPRSGPSWRNLPEVPPVLVARLRS